MGKQLQRHIDSLKQKLLFVGTLVEEAISKAIASLVRRDRSLAANVMDEEREIDRMEVDVEEECLRILATHQPVAADLRFVVAVLKINSDLERMGDLAHNIAQRVVALAGEERISLPDNLRPMATQTQLMVKQSLDALVNADAALARRVVASDDEVDRLRTDIRQFLEKKIADQPDRTHMLMQVLSISRHLERIADMATNVAEEVIYMVEGSIVRHRHEVASSGAKPA